MGYFILSLLITLIIGIVAIRKFGVSDKEFSEAVKIHHSEDTADKVG